jgi:hypothetical protein
VGALRHALAACCLCVVAPFVGARQASAEPVPILTLAGNGTAGFPLNPPSSPAGVSVGLANPVGVTPFSVNGGLALLADAGDARVLKLAADGTIRSVTGTGSAGYSGDNGFSALVSNLSDPQATAPYQPSGPIGSGFLIADRGNNRVRFVSASNNDNGNIELAAGNGTLGNVGPGGMAKNAQLVPEDVEAFGSFDNWLVADSFNHRVLSIALANPIRDGVVTTAAGSYSAIGPPSPAPTEGGSATGGDIGVPVDLAGIDAGPGFYVAVAENRVWKRDTSANIHTEAGTGVQGDATDAEPVASAKIGSPTGIAATTTGVLVYDGTFRKIRRVVSSGHLLTVAGTGAAGASPDGTPADAAGLDDAGRLALTTEGIIFSQPHQNLVRMLPATAIVAGPSGTVTTATSPFSFASWDRFASYGCRLDSDGATWAVCPSSYTVGDGHHKLDVRATTNAAAFVDPTPAVREWTVDTVPPADFGLIGPDDNTTSQSLRPSLTWNPSSDATSGIDRYEIWLDGAKGGQISTCQATCSFEFPAPLSELKHTWQIKAFDKAGLVRESATRSFTVSARPTAALVVAPGRALVGSNVTVDASGSSDEDGLIAKYEFDLDGDGTYETDSDTTAKLTRTYAHPQSLTISVRVTDGAGLIDSTGASLIVSSPPPAGKTIGVSINDGACCTNDPNVTLFAVWPLFATDMLLSNDGGFGKEASLLPVSEQVKWTLRSSGPERLPKLVYVRFSGVGQTRDVIDDIILDQTPPQVVSAQLADPLPPSANAAAAKRLTLRVTARDNVSGVGGIQVTGTKRKPGKFLKFRKTLKVRPAKMLYVRVRDRAGNRSRWRVARRR